MAESLSVQNVILALLRSPNESDRDFEARQDELVGLCEAAGGKVIQTFVQERAQPDSATYLGAGKVQEIERAAAETKANLVVFGEDLSPGQVRNLEARVNCLVIDRTQLILDIFALRARTREGRLQVEIAQLQYLMPRLTGRGREMSRLGGGIGTRGPGETKLESDRRRIRQRVSHLRSQLGKIRRQREIQRDRRREQSLVVALVGYTNAGKTTLLQRWAKDRRGAVVESGNQRLFDTLDPLARRVRAGISGELVLLDTVGFVSNLPHLLVDAFRATLEEVTSADLLVHVVDASYEPTQALQTTYQVLHEIGGLDKPVITFFNKSDMTQVLPGPDVQAVQSIFGSALTGQNVAELYSAVEKHLGMDPVELSIEGNIYSQELWRDLAKSAKVIESRAISDERMQLHVEVERRFVNRVRDRLAGLNAVTIETPGKAASTKQQSDSDPKKVPSEQFSLTEHLSASEQILPSEQRE